MRGQHRYHSIGSGAVLFSDISIARGETYGLSGKGKVIRDEEPGYFLMLLVARFILGSISLEKTRGSYLHY